MQIGKTTGFYVHRYCRHNLVTGSNYLYSAHWPNGENVRFFVEAGAKQGEDNIGFYNGFFPFNTKKISFGIITHNHFDHVGLLPVIVRQGFTGPIFTSYSTANLMDISLYDSTNIEDKDLRQTIATIDEVERTLNQVVGCTYKKRIKPHKNITITFFSNGHLVGAVLTLIVITCPGEEPITIIHTGDYKDENIFFNVEMPPKQVRNLNISNIVCESTYGDVDSNHPMFHKCLATNTAEALKNGITFLYPTFSQGRHQEALFNIKMWKNKGIIPENTVVVVDGKSSQEYNARYRYTDLGIKKIMKDFMPKGTINIPRSRNRAVYRRQILEDPRPKIILAPGGMGSYGPVTSYISELIPRNDVLIHSLGYCSPDSTMYKLLNAKYGETIHYNGRELTMRCLVRKTAEMSSHSPRNKLLRLINYFPNTCSVSINHGERKTQLSFREYLLDHLGLPEDQIMIANTEIGVRIESNGITDCFQTRFESIL